MTLAKIGSVYIQNGQGSTYYNGPTQVINHAAQITAPRYACPRCGYTSNDSWDFRGGMCNACRNVEQIKQEEAQLKRIAQAQRDRYDLIDGATGTIIIDEYKQGYQAAGVLHDWQQRHPRTVACTEANMTSADRAWAEVERVRLGH